MGYRRHARARTDAPASTSDRLVTTVEVCQRLTISRSTLWRLSREGDLPCVRITPTRIAWRESTIRAWLDAHEGAGR